MGVFQRLVTAQRGAARTLIFPTFGLILAILFLANVPWSLRNTDLARTYISPQVKQLLICVAAVVVIAGAVFLMTQIAVGLGTLASVYGRGLRSGALLASPWGIVGYRRQRIRLVPGEVVVQLASDAPMRPIYGYGVQRVHFVQGERTLHAVSYVKYSEASRARLVEWLAQRGITAVFEGDKSVLPG